MGEKPRVRLEQVPDDPKDPRFLGAAAIFKTCWERSGIPELEGVDPVEDLGIMLKGREIGVTGIVWVVNKKEENVDDKGEVVGVVETSIPESGEGKTLCVEQLMFRDDGVRLRFGPAVVSLIEKLAQEARTPVIEVHPYPEPSTAGLFLSEGYEVGVNIWDPETMYKTLGIDITIPDVIE